MSTPIAFDVRIEGDSLNSFGLETLKTVDGLGLITFGFLWSRAGIWAPGDIAPTNTWALCADSGGASLSTTWVVGETIPSTTWADSSDSGGL